MAQPSLRTRARRLAPHLIGLFFGGLWGTIAAIGLAPRYRPVAVALTGLLTLGLVATLWSRTADRLAQQTSFRKRSYLASVAGEVAALWAAATVLSRLALLNYLYSAVGVVVGVHFVGLWRSSGSRRFLRICAGMCLISALSILLPFSWKAFGPRYLFLGVANALVLWTGALARDE